MTLRIDDLSHEDWIEAMTLSDEDWEALESELGTEETTSGAEASLSVFKDATGRFRWVLLSSNAYRDRDGEIISTKALLDDVARADKDRDYGPLRWWHVPGADIGDCDFNAMSGRVLVESGTFRNEATGVAVFKEQRNLQASIGFRHPKTQPDIEKVYHNIRRFERSLTPTGRASNPFTKLVVQQERKMDKDKLEALKALIGEDGMSAIMEQVRATQKEAEALGTAFKEAGEPVADAVSAAFKPLTADDVARIVTSNTFTVTTNSNAGTLSWQADTATKAGDESETEKDDSAPETFPDDDTPLAEEPIYAGDLLPNELAALIANTVAYAIAPHMQAVRAEVEQVKSLMGNATKADDIALLQEQQSRQQAQEQQARLTLEATIKALASEHAKTATALKAAQAQLAELAGEQPRALKQEQGQGYRASQDPNTIVGDTHRLKEARPQGIDPNFFGVVAPEVFGNGKNEGPPAY